MMAIPAEEGTRRRHIRLGLHEGVFAELRVLRIGNRPVDTSPAKAVILNLSQGGLKFATTLRFDEHVQWEVGLRFLLQGVHLELRGIICHRNSEQHWQEYGVQMHDHPLMGMLITRVLNQTLISKSPELARMHRSYGKLIGSE